MYVLLRMAVFATSLSWLCAGMAWGEEPQSKVLVIAADLSGSMFYQGPPSQRRVQAQEQALRDAFSADQYYCGDLTIVFFGWSDEVHEGEYVFNLSTEDKKPFLDGVTRLSNQVASRDTDHLTPYEHAREIFADYPDHEHYLLITTDNSGTEQHLPELLPDATVFVIAYTDASAAYAEQNMVENEWDVLSAEGHQQTTMALNMVLQEVIASVCVGS